MSSIEALHSIADKISAGFDVLIELLAEQRKVENELRARLADALDKFHASNSDNPSDGSLSLWQDEIVKQISGSPNKRNTSVDLNNVPAIIQARQAINLLKSEMPGSDVPRRCPMSQKHGSKPNESQSMTPTTMQKRPVVHVKAQQIYEELERDFTTRGKPSNLECPFAQMNQDGQLETRAEVDPIAAEFHADALSRQSLEEARACGKCPIRFMDKHSPQEVAEYFEKHKHELPRSHEICVKRYQQNENSVRQLDAKYGNIVSMIQGLGNKHKPYLSNDEQAALTGADQKSSAAVERWADEINGNTNANAQDADTSLDQRLSRFESPLREVRVGESPTRPWGIHVPLDRPRAPSAVSSKSSSQRPSSKAVVDEPVIEAAGSAQDLSSISSKRSRSKGSTQIIFNGPVFLGYSAEQAATFLQQLGANGRGT